MKTIRHVLFLIAAVLLGLGLANATLPPPTAEEQAAAADSKAKEQAQLEKEKVLLERVQDQIAARFRKPNTVDQRAAGERTSDHNMPKTTSELPRGVGPDPQRQPSAEAHSGSAK